MESGFAASGVVLAGGTGRRMGRDKATLSVGGVTLLERAVTAVSQVAVEVLVAGRIRGDLAGRHVRFVDDMIPGAGPLGGIATALAQMRREYLITVACDLPFLNADLLAHLLSLGPGHDAVVPRIGGKPQPTHAVYARIVGTIADRHLNEGRYRLADLLPALRVRWVEEDEIEVFDPQHLSFVNINTAEDWERWRAAAALSMPGRPE